MAPYSAAVSNVIDANAEFTTKSTKRKADVKKGIISNDQTGMETINYKRELIWTNILLITLLHIVAIYGLLTFPYHRKLRTFLFGKYLLFVICSHWANSMWGRAQLIKFTK